MVLRLCRPGSAVTRCDWAQHRGTHQRSCGSAARCGDAIRLGSARRNAPTVLRLCRAPRQCGEACLTGSALSSLCGYAARMLLDFNRCYAGLRHTRSLSLPVPHRPIASWLASMSVIRSSKSEARTIWRPSNSCASLARLARLEPLSVTGSQALDVLVNERTERAETLLKHDIG